MQLAYQIGKKENGTLEHSDRHNALAGEIRIDLFGQSRKATCYTRRAEKLHKLVLTIWH